MFDATYLRAMRDLSREMIARFGEVHCFAWKQGKRGGKYWLPDGKQDAPGNRLYGAKADRAAGASARTSKKGAVDTPNDPDRKAFTRAKYQVARDAANRAKAEGAPRDQQAWLKARAEHARAELLGKPLPPVLPTPPSMVERMTRYPRDLVSGVNNSVRRAYTGLENRYGPSMAKAIIGAGIAGLPLPIPGSEFVTAAIPLGIAELNHQVRNVLGFNTPATKPGEFKREATVEPVVKRKRTEVRGKPVAAITLPAKPKPTTVMNPVAVKPPEEFDPEALAKAVNTGIVGTGRRGGWGYDFTKAHEALKGAKQEIAAFARKYPRKVVPLAKKVTGHNPESTQDAERMLNDFVSESLDLLDKGHKNRGIDRHSEVGRWTFAESRRHERGLRVLMWVMAG